MKTPKPANKPLPAFDVVVLSLAWALGGFLLIILFVLLGLGGLSALLRAVF
jgi:hypothetical protein